MRYATVTYNFSGRKFYRSLPLTIVRLLAQGDEDVFRWRGLGGDFALSHLCSNAACSAEGHVVLEIDGENNGRKACRDLKVCNKTHEPRCLTGLRLGNRDRARILQDASSQSDEE